MRPVVYYDYTCDDSHRLKLLLDQLEQEPEWKTLSLKEVKRHDDETSFLEGEHISSISVLALAVAHAVRGLDFDRYHSEVFEAFHQEDRRLTVDEILEIAKAAGLDPARFKSSEPNWLTKVAIEHRHAVETLGVFGTPTVVFGPGRLLYVEPSQVPETPKTAAEVWELIERVASRPEISQLERPESPSC